MGNQQIRVVLVDDHVMVRKGIKALLHQYPDILVVGEASNEPAAVVLVNNLKPDVVVIDLLMQAMDGIEAIKRMIAKDRSTRIIVLTGYAGEDKVLQAINAGAMGYLNKDIHPDELVQSIRTVTSGEPSFNPKIAWKLLRQMNCSETPPRAEVELSEREREVLRLLSIGKSDQEIAEELFLADVTIRTHIRRILPKLGLKNRVQAALYSIQSGLVSLNEASETER